ncbi:hypothetical protein L6164_002701 [Bauhinia variegata]|uniref:Uncharacterized protein n=1 Tax=Bauhinia variegata TaxID=167791 RepID=A0ACB9PZ43_BAUVA|nr:hypothetical protein L6164_002701 [Bauhinia variegata]
MQPNKARRCAGMVVGGQSAAGGRRQTADSGRGTKTQLPASVKFPIELESNLGSNATVNSTLPDWRTRPMLRGFGLKYWPEL